MIALLSIVCAAVPWIVLLVSVFSRLVTARRLQTWQGETVIVGLASALVTVMWADHAIGWIAYGAALLGHGRASISSRVGTAYERLVRLPGGDAHAVECLGVQRWYSFGALALAGLAAVAAGAWPAAAQLALSEVYARWRRWFMARAVAS